MKQNNSLLLFLMGLLSCAQAFATDYYIDPTNGSNNNNGLSSNTAFRSLYQVDNLNLQPGDIVYFMDGVYQRPGQTLLTINESGTEENWITFRNYPNHTPVLEFDSWTGIDIIGGSSYINIDGLHVKGAREKINLEDALSQGGSCANNFTGNVNGFYNGTGILAVGPNLTWSNGATKTVPHHINVTNCEIYDCTSSGIAFQQADYITVKNNKVYDNCWYTIYGTSGINLYQLVNTDETKGFHNEITNNLIYGNKLLVPQVSLELCQFLDGNGLIVDDLKHTQTENYKDPSKPFDPYDAITLIANNIAVENGGSGLHFYLSDWCFIFNNTVANNAFQNDGDNGNAELRIGASTNFWVRNNIFKGDNTIHHYEVAPYFNINYLYNYQYGPDIAEELIDCEGCVENIELEFLNEDVTSETPYITDFNSIITDVGTQYINHVNSDYLDNPKPYAGGYDIGAYELYDCTLTTWYADTDTDGLGDENESIKSCEQPKGYVAESGDLCNNDINKSAPGECGCEVAEGTCEEVCENPTNWYADIDNDGFGDVSDLISDCEQPEGYVNNSSDLCPNDNIKSEPGECGCEVEEGTCEEVCENPTNWYADRDNDGFGDANDIISDCEQPEGYVNNSSDLCPNDTIKSEPGECGCGIDEGTCGNPEDLCDSPEYSNSAVYADSGTNVIYNGSVYSNKWYTSGQLPTSGGPWELIEYCNSELTDCSTLNSWSSTAVYAFAGTQIEYNQSIYENKWYITGDSPDNSNAWALVGFCEPILSLNNGTNVLVNSSPSNFEVNVYNIDGSLELSTTATSNNISDLNLSELSPDIYIVSFTNLDTGITASEKIVK